MTIAGISMQNDLLRLNSISQNLANVLTSGYKREIPITRSFDSHVQEASASSGVAADPARTQSDAPVIIDSAPGTLRATANPLDVAIEGEGFFEVATEQGPAYTRQGNFHTDVQGRLVTAQGLPVMGTSGEISLPAGLPVTIDRNGDVRQADQVIGRIKLAHFENPSALLSAGNGLFMQGAARSADIATATALRSGYQENSNVNSSQEMVRLSETVRHFEAMQKLMQGYGDALEQSIRKLGEF